MVFRKEAGIYVVRLDRGEIFFEALIPFIAEQELHSGFFYGLGGADWAELGLYDLASREYQFKYFAGPLEITNVSGNISLADGLPKIHAHATISGPDMLASGGHVKGIGVAGTMEIYIQTLPFQLTRRRDDETGLELLHLAE